MSLDGLFSSIEGGGCFCTTAGIHWWDSRQYEVLAVMAFTNLERKCTWAMMALQEERSPDVSNGLDIMDKSSYRNIPPL